MEESIETNGKTTADDVGVGGNLSTKSEAPNQDGNVVIIENLGENISDNVDGLDPSLLRYVQQLLVQAGGQQYVVIVENGGNSEQTFRIELLSGDGAEGCDDLNNPVSSYVATSAASTAVTTHGLTSDVTGAVLAEVNVDNSPPFTAASLPEQPSFCVETQPSVQQAVSTNVSLSTDLPSVGSSCDPTLHHTSSTGPSYLDFKLAPQTSPTAESLLDIAHKIITNKEQDATSMSKLVSGKGHLSYDPLKEGEKHKPESVITMYLSSPSELKNKLETLKDNSPVIVVQAQTDLVNPNRSGDTPGHETQPVAAAAGKIVAPTIASPKEVTGMGSVDLAKPASSEQVVESPAGGLSGEESVVYRCQECGYSSHNKHYYKQHVDLVHNDDRPYKCPHCDYAGKRRHALLEHMVVHSNNRPFTCGHCNASFRKKGHLTNHIKLHTSQRLVHCGVCNIQLPDSEAFEAHLRKIHKTDKLYKCKLCDHTVVDRETMIKHFQTHSECQLTSENSFQEQTGVTHGSQIISSFDLKSAPAYPSLNGKNVAKASLAKIMCSECGFISTDQETMQQHLWTHIRSGTVSTTSSLSGLKVNTSEASKENSMGVLKKNIDSGQKSLPKDVFYQCTSCSFTSSDNSAFIKHMLAHKTQEKHVREAHAAVEIPSLQDAKGPATDAVHLQVSGTNKTPLKPSVPVAYTGLVPAKCDNLKDKSENSVPFIYDKASARFRCLICNYHCEFQRTIKAHIWKHSGHQNIEYPMFDQSGNATSGLANVTNVSNSLQKTLSHGARSDTCPNLGKEKGRMVSVNPSRGPLQAFQTRPGDAVCVLPVNPSTAKCNTGQLSQVQNKTVIVPENVGKTSAVSMSLQSAVVKKEDKPDQVKFQQTITADVKPPVAKTGDHKALTNTVSEERSVPTRNSAATNSAGQSNDQELSVKDEEKISDKVLASAIKNADVVSVDGAGSSCPEPSVVVETVDSIPPGDSLTGLKSQQGSPRVSDLESSGGDTKFAAQVRSVVLKSTDNSADSDTSVSESGEHRRTTEQVSVQEKQSSATPWFRCPFCDRQVQEDLKTHLLNCKPKVSGAEVGQSESKPTDMLKSCGDKMLPASTPEQLDSLLLDDTDSTESSDETATGEAQGNKKSGICSSLLAVIEQLRERSRSESEEDKQGQMWKKSSKKKGHQADLALGSIDEFKNIEKIRDNDGEKFRCVLCHYTSERIYNIKIHMKTHRQKKPTECSLCDFSSTSPEALQQHMLKHCKIRTYACKYCPQSFNHKSTLRAHMRAHKDQEPFRCAYCVFETSNAQEYREHMHVHSGCSSRLRCPGCDLLLGGKDELTAHLLGCKGRTTGSSVEPRSTSHVRLHENLPSKLALESNTDATGRLGVDNLKQETTPSVLPATVSCPGEHRCVVQGCTFSSPSLKDLQDHLGVHCNPSLLVCNLCDFKAWHTRSLKSHMKRHANDQRYVQQPLEQYKCNLCGYVCHHLPSLKSHMWRHASDQSYSYEFTNDVINAAIDHDNRVDASGEADDPELLDQVINSERKILEGELTKCKRGDGQRPICWVTFRCCSCGFETINKAKLNIHMRTHSDLIQQAQADIIPRRKRPGFDERPQGQTTNLPKMIKTENM
ncbi:zinc finger protein 507-like [Elysia marginata]|uniref:Zinc finger protein 507-like n=1 Tax=Elysia marginata TaxID=1093978 RepID=A0AAV4JGT9_9GAST|nr:zinc finger protein 507-like [Elysia marginata]